jgi:hypothetical protein
MCRVYPILRVRRSVLASHVMFDARMHAMLRRGVGGTLEMAACRDRPHSVDVRMCTLHVHVPLAVSSDPTGYAESRRTVRTQGS